MNEYLEKILKNSLIKFAKENIEIKAITRGNDPESGDRVYYMITPNIVYDEKLFDKITELEINLYQLEIDSTILFWPVSVDKISDYGFLGELIWQAS